jgi:hypothetical protein
VWERGASDEAWDKHPQKLWQELRQASTEARPRPQTLGQAFKEAMPTPNTLVPRRRID